MFDRGMEGDVKVERTQVGKDLKVKLRGWENFKQLLDR